MSLKEKQKKTKYLAVSAMLCALGVILLFGKGFNNSDSRENIGKSGGH